MFDPQIVINVRDRVHDLRSLVAWLENAGHERITLLDNASTWPPLLEYLLATPHKVVRLGRNHGSRAIWAAGLAPEDEYFVYTDPDVVPIDECPIDAVAHLYDVLRRNPAYQKAGLGLHLDDVPQDLHCLGWERSLVTPEAEVTPGVFRSLIDTTFALHRPGTPHLLPALRTGYPYSARHMPWYVREPDAEDAYYLARAIVGPAGSSWAQQEAA